MKTSEQELTLEVEISPVADLAVCELAGETAILHLGSGTYYGLDAIGTRIWSLIPTTPRVADLVERLLQEYDVDRRVCEGDLLRLVGEMTEQGLVQARDAVHA